MSLDLYGTNANAIAMGNARMQQVRDLNERIKEHNNDVANQISGLKDQEKTADKVAEIKATGQALWTSKDMPSKVKAYNDWVNQPKATNPTTNTARNLQSDVEESPNYRYGVESSADLPAKPQNVAEAEEITGETGGAGSELLEGTKTALDTEGKSVLGSIGEKVGVLGSAALGGLDLYEDIKAGGIAGNNNWEKAGNLLQIGGSIADIGGNFFPPLKLLGGVLDLGSAATDQVGQQLDEDKESDELKQKQQQETEQEVAAPEIQTIATGRVS